MSSIEPISFRVMFLYIPDFPCPVSFLYLLFFFYTFHSHDNKSLDESKSSRGSNDTEGKARCMGGHDDAWRGTMH